MSAQVTNVAGYQFIKIADIESVHRRLQRIAAQTHLKGSIFISPEGVNVSLAGDRKDIDFILHKMQTTCGFHQLLLNFTYSSTIPFKRLLIKNRDALVAIGHPTDTNEQAPPAHLPYITSATLKQWLDDDIDFTLLDLRNDFEYGLGSFNRARHLGLRNFRELKNSINRLENIPKDKPVVTFCTGGIRCEKGAPFIARRRGFERVLQLKGGILDYLSTSGDAHWHGDCFVFDERISLDSRLQPTFARLCRSCQTPLQDSEERFCTACAGLT